MKAKDMIRSSAMGTIRMQLQILHQSDNLTEDKAKECERFVEDKVWGSD